MNILDIIGREELLFVNDTSNNEKILTELITNAKIMVIGAAGSIGQAVSLEIFKRNPKVLHLIDMSENNLVELVRTLRSSIGYSVGEFKTFAIDCNSAEFSFLMNVEGPYDYIFNLSALKHVRSEKDPYTLMRLIQTNIFNPVNVIRHTSSRDLKNYFCVSTDKAANPVNMMGASKKIMEQYLTRESSSYHISMARFANVAFSDGSLLHGFNQRFAKRQPLTAPSDIRRYFLVPEEAGELCMLSGFLGGNREIFFPKLDENLHLERFSQIAIRFLESLGFEPVECDSEQEARERMQELHNLRKWPVYFFNSDTSGEKAFEEFYTHREELDLNRFNKIGVIFNDMDFNDVYLTEFESTINDFRKRKKWDKAILLEEFKKLVPEFEHIETGKSLESRM